MTRGWLQGLRTPVLVLLLLSGAVALGWLAQRYAVSVDVGAGGELQLSTTSRRLLARLDGPVQVTVFLPADSELRGRTERLLDAYRAAKPDMGYRVVDPKSRPELVRKLGVTRRGEAVIRYKGRREHAMAPTQARISAAMERLLAGGVRYIAFLTGHGERDLLGIANFDLGQFGRRLQDKGFRLQPLKLDADTAVPDNTRLLVVADPQTPLGPQTRKALAAYLDRGGALLWLTDPARNASIPALTELLGVRRRPGVIADPTAGEMLALDDPRMLLLRSKDQDERLRAEGSPVLLPKAAALEVDTPGGWRRTDLLQTSPKARVVPLSGAKDDGTGPAGVRTVAVGLSRAAGAAHATREQRVAVVGDGDFLSNSYLGNAGNLPVGLNLVQWLTASDTLLSTYQPAAPDQQLELSRPEKAVVGLGFLAVLPLLLALIGVYRWWVLRRG